MAQVVIADASCLIMLEKIGELELLHQTLGDVAITFEVRQEFVLALPEWIHVEAIGNLEQYEALRRLLDAGEASSIALALEKQDDCLLIIDEKRGRQVARRFGLSIVGTLGILLEAKRLAIIPAIRPLTVRLIQAGFRVGPGLLETVLRQAGELA